MKKIFVLMCALLFILTSCSNNNDEITKLEFNKESSNMQLIYEEKGIEIFDTSIIYNVEGSDSDAIVNFLIVAEKEKEKYHNMKILKTQNNFQDDSVSVRALEEKGYISFVVFHSNSVQEVYDVEEVNDNEFTIKLVKSYGNF